MSKLSNDDQEIVEGVIEFVSYMSDRAENEKLSKALIEQEKNWTMVLEAARGGSKTEKVEAKA